MRKLFRISTLAALALGATALTAQAQKATEITGGLIGLSTTSVSGSSVSLFQFNTGGAFAAIAFYLSPGMSIEPIFTSSHISVSGGGGSQTSVGIGVAVPYYFKKDWGRTGAYLAPRLGWTSFSCTGCSSVTQFNLGLALGYKVPLNTMAALRLQAGYDYGFSNADVNATSSFGFSLGLSVFLKK